MTYTWRFLDRDGVEVHTETTADGVPAMTFTVRHGRKYRMTFASAKMKEIEYREVAPGGAEG